jgi:hypothetical protein
MSEKLMSKDNQPWPLAPTISESTLTTGANNI